MAEEYARPRSFLGYAVAIVFGFAAGALGFVLWAILKRGPQ